MWETHPLVAFRFKPPSDWRWSLQLRYRLLAVNWTLNPLVHGPGQEKEVKVSIFLYSSLNSERKKKTWGPVCVNRCHTNSRQGANSEAKNRLPFYFQAAYFKINSPKEMQVGDQHIKRQLSHKPRKCKFKTSFFFYPGNSPFPPYPSGVWTLVPHGGNWFSLVSKVCPPVVILLE